MAISAARSQRRQALFEAQQIFHPAPQEDQGAKVVTLKPHAFRRSDSAFVFRQCKGGRWEIEGRAEIIRLIGPIQDFYEVHFFGEPTRITRERYVHAGIWQTDPFGHLDTLNTYWRESLVMRELSAGLVP